MMMMMMMMKMLLGWAYHVPNFSPLQPCFEMSWLGEATAPRAWDDQRILQNEWCLVKNASSSEVTKCFVNIWCTPMCITLYYTDWCLVSSFLKTKSDGCYVDPLRICCMKMTPDTCHEFMSGTAAKYFHVPHVVEKCWWCAGGKVLWKSVQHAMAHTATKPVSWCVSWCLVKRLSQRQPKQCQCGAALLARLVTLRHQHSTFWTYPRSHFFDSCQIVGRQSITRLRNQSFN